MQAGRKELDLGLARVQLQTHSNPSQKEYGLVCKFWAGMTVEKIQLCLSCELMKFVMNMSGGKSGILCAVQIEKCIKDQFVMPKSRDQTT